MKKVFDSLLKDNKDGAQVQLVFNNGAASAGALKKAKGYGDDMYELLTGMQRKKGGPLEAIRMIFRASSVSSVMLPLEQPEIITPKSRIVMPGRA